MTQWIPFSEGNYLVEQAFLIAPDHKAVPLEDSVIEVFADPRGMRHMNGQGLVRNVLVVQLFEEYEDMDLLMDMGEEFKYLLRKPTLQAGKVFSPHIKSALRFTPTRALEQIPEKEFEALVSRLTLLSL